MKQLFSILLSTSFGLVGFSQYDFNPNLINEIAEQEALSKSNLANYKSSEPLNDYDIFYHRAIWFINPAEIYISGSITTYFTTTQDISEIGFDLSQQLSVDSIIFHSSHISYTHSQEILTLQFPQPLSQGSVDSVTVYYCGMPQTENGSFDNYYHDTLNTNVPALWTLSEPYGAKDWWPCKQSLDDKIDSIDIIVTCPAEYRTASIGILHSEIVVGNNKTMHWKHKYPITTYLIAFAVTNYVDYSDYVLLEDGDSLEILNFVYPEDLDYAMENTPHTIELIQLYSDLFIPYPFSNERYGHAQFGRNGGMEHQTMTFMGNFKFELIAHELAHHWFGNYITCASWKDIWLNEGFAVFLSGLAYEYLLDGYWYLPWKESLISSITSEPDGSVYVYDTTSVSRVFSSRLSYKKGAFLLHMLRWELGDEDFFLALNNYLTDSELAYGYATTNDFIYHLENAADTSLTEFFDDWFYGEGYPIYEIEYLQNTTNEVTLIINQTTSDLSVDFFEMHLPILFKGTTKDTLIVLYNTFNNQGFHAQLDFEIEDLDLDPDLWILTTTPTIKINEDLNEVDFFLIPNPAINNILITPLNKLPIKQIAIYDISGKTHYINTDNMILDNHIIDISELSSGVYIVKIIFGNGSAYKRFVKI